MTMQDEVNRRIVDEWRVMLRVLNDVLQQAADPDDAVTCISRPLRLEIESTVAMANGRLCPTCRGYGDEQCPTCRGEGVVAKTG